MSKEVAVKFNPPKGLAGLNKLCWEQILSSFTGECRDYSLILMLFIGLNYHWLHKDTSEQDFLALKPKIQTKVKLLMQDSPEAREFFILLFIQTKDSYPFELPYFTPSHEKLLSHISHIKKSDKYWELSDKGDQRAKSLPNSILFEAIIFEISRRILGTLPELKESMTPAPCKGMENTSTYPIYFSDATSEITLVSQKYYFEENEIVSSKQLALTQDNAKVLEEDLLSECLI